MDLDTFRAAPLDSEQGFLKHRCVRVCTFLSLYSSFFTDNRFCYFNCILFDRARLLKQSHQNEQWQSGRGSGSTRRRAAAGGGPAAGRGAGGGSSNILQFYTDDSPGLQVGPTTVLVASLSFVGIVVLLHIWGKFRM